MRAEDWSGLMSECKHKTLVKSKKVDHEWVCSEGCGVVYEVWNFRSRLGLWRKVFREE